MTYKLLLCGRTDGCACTHRCLSIWQGAGRPTDVRFTRCFVFFGNGGRSTLPPLPFSTPSHPTIRRFGNGDRLTPSPLPFSTLSHPMIRHFGNGDRLTLSPLPFSTLSHPMIRHFGNGSLLTDGILPFFFRFTWCAGFFGNDSLLKARKLPFSFLGLHNANLYVACFCSPSHTAACCR